MQQRLAQRTVCSTGRTGALVNKGFANAREKGGRTTKVDLIRCKFLEPFFVHAVSLFRRFCVDV